MDATRTGTNCEYSRAHRRVKLRHGPASSYLCIGCGNQARDWAYDHLDPEERYVDGVRLPFSDDPKHYQPLCDPCHARFDLSPIAVPAYHPPPEALIQERAQARLADLLFTHSRVVMTDEWRKAHPRRKMAARSAAA